MARPRKARVEGAEAEGVEAPAKTPDPVPGNNGAALERIVAFFRAEHPDDWADWHLCPLESGLAAMIERLK
jgi:hypothetical protein